MRDGHRRRRDVEDGGEGIRKVARPQEIADGGQEGGRARHHVVEGSLDRGVADLIIQSDPRALREHQPEVPGRRERTEQAERGADAGVRRAEDGASRALADTEAHRRPECLDDERDPEEETDRNRGLDGPVVRDQAGNRRSDQGAEEEPAEQSGQREDGAAQAAPEARQRKEDEEHEDDGVEVVHVSAQCAVAVPRWEGWSAAVWPASTATRAAQDGQEAVDHHERQNEQRHAGEQQFGLRVHRRIVKDARTGRHEDGPRLGPASRTRSSACSTSSDTSSRGASISTRSCC